MTPMWTSGCRAAAAAYNPTVVEVKTERLPPHAMTDWLNDQGRGSVRERSWTGCGAQGLRTRTIKQRALAFLVAVWSSG